MRIFALLCGILTICQVQSQLFEVLGDLLQQHINRQLSLPNLIATSIRNDVLNDILGQAVRFIVHETAVPTQELLDLAITMRRSPRTREERQRYVTVMKKIARNTPHLVAKYVKEKKHSNGTVTASVDYLAMEADVVRRALRFNEMNRRRNGNSRTTTSAPAASINIV